MLRTQTMNRTKTIAGLCLGLLALIMLAGAFSAPRISFALEPLAPDGVPPVPAGSAYRQTNFISDIPGVAFIQKLNKNQ